jgi:hypothetical protein
MKMSFTPGPWEIEGEGQDTVGILSVGDNHYIAKLTGWAHSKQDANARLISAAPELLEALKGLVEEVKLSKLNIRKDFSLINAHACATKAIHKAMGGFNHDRQ